MVDFTYRIAHIVELIIHRGLGVGQTHLARDAHSHAACGEIGIVAVVEIQRGEEAYACIAVIAVDVVEFEEAAGADILGIYKGLRQAANLEREGGDVVEAVVEAQALLYGAKGSCRGVAHRKVDARDIVVEVEVARRTHGPHQAQVGTKVVTQVEVKQCFKAAGAEFVEAEMEEDGCALLGVEAEAHADAVGLRCLKVHLHVVDAIGAGGVQRVEDVAVVARAAHRADEGLEVVNGADAVFYHPVGPVEPLQLFVGTVERYLAYVQGVAVHEPDGARRLQVLALLFQTAFYGHELVVVLRRAHIAAVHQRIDALGAEA